MRTRQIIRYRATATIWRPQMKRYTASNEMRGGGGEGLPNQQERHTKCIVLTKYEAVQPTGVSENANIVHFVY